MAAKSVKLFRKQAKYLPSPMTHLLICKPKLGLISLSSHVRSPSGARPWRPTQSSLGVEATKLAAAPFGPGARVVYASPGKTLTPHFPEE